MEDIIKNLFARLGYHPTAIHWCYDPAGKLDIHGDLDGDGIQITASSNPRYWRVKRYSASGSGELILVEDDELDLPLDGGPQGGWNYVSVPT
jgi:hypothetical protein